MISAQERKRARAGCPKWSVCAVNDVTYRGRSVILPLPAASAFASPGELS
jgi:hypothetical protein